ncbi:lactonase family protein [Formosa agariphila]|uniref:lactonase family protein n=1 Tax=Formosa agariphila TaxID=320324 RepID=UPI001F58FFE8|nr:lactonase family protein [Formosa agariphila]
MRILLSIISLSFCLLVSCDSKKSTPKAETISYPFFVGTYTTKDSKGIYKYELNEDGTFKEIGLQAITESPSFISLSADKTHLVSGNKLDPKNGTLSSFKIQGDSLIPQNVMDSGGVNPCHVTINKDNYVLASNYVNGSLGLLHLNEEGLLSNVLNVQQHTGKGITPRQEGPHAHSSYFVPNSDEIIAIDLGTDQLWFYKIDKESNTLQPSEPKVLNLPEGAGPRHLTFHPNNKWIYVLNELNNTVSKIERLGEHQYELKESITTIPKDFTEASYAADIHISSDGEFVYISNRGHNSIAIFKTDSDDGSLTLLGFESTRGDFPRNFSLSPNEDYVIVANQHTDNLVSYKRDAKTGLLTFVDEIKSPTPSCILFQ